MFPLGPALSNGSWAFERMHCQGRPSRGNRIARLCRSARIVAAWAWCTAPAAASTSVEVNCPALDRESAAAFEARAHTELLVRRRPGALALDCSGGARLTWTPTEGASRSREVSSLGTDALLSALVALLEADVPAAAPPSVDPPKPTSRAPSSPRSPSVDLRLGVNAHSWAGQAALGSEITVGVPISPLTILASGHVSRGVLSYGYVSLYLLEARVGAELAVFGRLRVAAGGGAGRPFTTETANVARVDDEGDPWFLEGFLRVAFPVPLSEQFRVDAGAEAALFSRPLRLQVDRTRAYDFGWQPGIFLQGAFELR